MSEEAALPPIQPVDVSAYPEGAHRSLHARERTQEEVDRVFLEEWAPLFMGPGGKIVLELVKRELYDMHHLCVEAAKVYHHFTGGLTDDLTASAEGIIAAGERRIARMKGQLVAENRRLTRELRREQERVRVLDERVRALRAGGDAKPTPIPQEPEGV